MLSGKYTAPVGVAVSHPEDCNVDTSENETREPQTVEEAGAKGGRARAERLTPEERREIARKAAEERWKAAGKQPQVPVATHTGDLKLGDLVIPCAVLDDGTRLLSETGIVKALGLYRSGAVQTREKAASEPGAQMPLFVANKNIKPFVDDDLAAVLRNPIWYIPSGSGTRHKGVKAEVIPRICNVWLSARDAKALRGKRQELVAVKADIIMRALAHVAIIALVDEATGYQDVRAKDALAKILERFVAKELQPYLTTFPLDFFKELCRLRGIPFPENMRLPPYFGKLVNRLVYCRLAPGVLAELQRKNPAITNPVTRRVRRKDKNYKWLTSDMGHPKLLQLLGSEVTLMRMSQSYEELEKLVDKYHPAYKHLPLFDWAEKQNHAGEGDADEKGSDA
jgi:hypothetical protein